MKGAFDFKMRAMLCLNRNLPYGTTGPEMDFFEAAFDGDIPRLREMVRGKDAKEKARLADVCFADLGALQAAARQGNLDVVRYLVEDLSFDIDGGSSELGLTALSCAALDGNLDIVRYLLDKGADPNKKDEIGEVALHCAAKYGHDEVAKLLLSTGAIVDIAYSDGSPLHISAFYGKTNVIKVLLEHHADPNLVSELGTPIHATLHATNEGLEESISLQCVKLLVEAGADVNSTDPNTPLVLATSYGLTDCIEYLLKAGANANIPHNCCGAMPIETAAGYGRRKHVEMLFPFTSPIQTVSSWTVDGIITHVKSKHSKKKVGLKFGGDRAVGRKGCTAASKLSETEQYGKSTKVKLNYCGAKDVGRKDCTAASKPYSKVEQYGKSAKDKLKLDGDKAVGRKDYLAASKLYGEAIELDSTDAVLYSNRSICLLQIGEATRALSDANSCIKLRPEWIKGYYRKGAALMSLKEYKEACDAFMAGLKLDPTNADMERMFREAVEAMKKDRVGLKTSSLLIRGPSRTYVRSGVSFCAAHFVYT